MSGSEGGRPPIRIGNAEREAACGALDAHLEAGRLDPDEYGDRYARATMARTRDDLTALFVDLPAPHPFPPEQQRRWAPVQAPAWQRHVPVSFAGRVLAALVVLAVLAVAVPVLVVGALVWFVVIPMATGRGCHRAWSARRGWYGPAWR